MSDCTPKHAWILGIVIVIVLAFFGYAMSSIAAYDARLRTVENQSARIEERLISIQQSVNFLVTQNRGGPSSRIP